MNHLHTMSNIDNTKFDSNNQIVAHYIRHVIVKRSVLPTYYNHIIILSYNANNSAYYITVDSCNRKDIIEFTILKSNKGGFYDEKHAIKLFNSLTD